MMFIRPICIFIFVVALSVFTTGSAQDIKLHNRLLNLGLCPGIGSNGLDPFNYENSISINVFSSNSGANKNFELSGISSFHMYSSKGVQLAGFANIIGGNRKEKKTYTPVELIKFSSDFTGVQVSGFANLVTGDFTGVQISGGFNLSKYGSVTGIQVGSLMNYSNGLSTGIQLSGLVNLSKKTLFGAQIAGLFNSTEGDLIGMQIGFWNAATNLYGIKSPKDFGIGFQLGGVNISRTQMNGIQIGLVNHGQNVSGIQVGLININRQSKGYPVSLLTLGVGRAGVKVFYDNIAPLNLQILTGSKHITNSILFGYEHKKFLAGYSIGHISFIANKGMFNHVELMMRALDLNFTKFKFTPIYSLQNSFGRHFYHGFYIFAAAGFNYDYASYFIDRNRFFASYSFGIAGVY